MSETSQPLDAFSNNILLANTVPNNNPGGTEFQFFRVVVISSLPRVSSTGMPAGPNCSTHLRPALGGSFSKGEIRTLFPPSVSFQFYSHPTRRPHTRSPVLSKSSLLLLSKP
ncbi:hypothetical protein B0H14DRAFT_3148514 [Mycena olivaceomarginata]|nr:hypothetical protein B0H14DRAFT_3148514 [Mycena olivaceomarginata]